MALEDSTARVRRATRAPQPSAASADTDAPTRAWWMLVHQLPPRPPGLRMRIWRRLQELGALQLKGSVYLLPATDEAREDLQWVLAEIHAGGAEASLWCAASIEGCDDADLVLRFRAAAAAEYETLAKDAEALVRRGGAENARRLRLRARFDAAVRRDHFAAPARATVERLLQRLEPAPPGAAAPSAGSGGRLDPAAFRGRTWTTRAHVHVDRMASAWLIRRFIDPQASFEFAAAARPAARPGVLRFDTFGGEFTHEGERCTFEVLVQRFGLQAPGLQRLAQVVHDIDLKESRYAHAETRGIAASLDAVAAAPLDDDARVALSATLFDGLLAQFAAAERGTGA